MLLILQRNRKIKHVMWQMSIRPLKQKVSSAGCELRARNLKAKLKHLGFCSSPIKPTMKLLLLCSLSFFSTFSLSSLVGRSNGQNALSPPRGWNSYDSFCWTVSEEEFLENARLVSDRLRPSGYEYVVVDYLWYRRKVPGAYVDSRGFDVIDEWGRMVPDPGRWPSSRGGRGFTEVARKVHEMGLKFGIHVMRGISTQAFNANTPILDTTTGAAYEESGRRWRARDMGLKERTCAWMQNGFMSVNTKLGAGRAFLRSLYQQYADWGVDFVKHDCVFGADLDIDEITVVSEVLRSLSRPVIYSLSPGTSVTPEMAKAASGLTNMYRITADDWDKWDDVVSHFDVSRDFATANMTGSKGLRGRSWPDLDMLPLGWLSEQGSNDGPHRWSGLSLDEQRTQMTLWSMAKSPLMFGGDVRKLNETTYNLITNPVLLEINTFSSNNKEFPYLASSRESLSELLQHQRDVEIVRKHAVGLSSCDGLKAKGWSSEALDQDFEKICWKGNTRSTLESPFCLHKKRPLLASHDMIYNQQYQGTTHLLATDGIELCLTASPEQRQASNFFGEGSFANCKWDANQMWELNTDGALRSSYSGLCATVDPVIGDSRSGGVRSWIATGRKGDIYLAFFNLNSEKTVMSAKMTDLARALRVNNLDSRSCRYREVWSGEDFGGATETISATVEVHGCALFVIHCSSNTLA